MLRCSEPKKRAPYSKWGKMILLVMGKMKIVSNMIHLMSCLPPMKTRLESQLKIKKKKRCAKVIRT